MARPCGKCNAPIFFALMPSGRSMPMDAAPVTDGAWVLLDGYAAPANDHPNHSGPRYRTHFATCSNPEAFRKPKGT